MKSQREKDHFRAHSKEIKSIAFSADGRTLATGGEEGNIILWNVVTKREMISFETTYGVGAIAFSRDGKYLAASSGGGRTLHLWKIFTPPSP